MTKRAYDKIAAGLNEALATAPTRLTPAQRKALLWLPKDGSYAIRPGPVAAALNSLHLYHASLVEIEDGMFGRRGAYCSRYRLTPAGMAAREELEKRGDAS